MKKKEIIYHNADGIMVKEKLMVMHSESGRVYIDEADCATLYQNIKEVYHWALKGKEIYNGWRKVFQTDQVVSELVLTLRQANRFEDFIHQIKEQYKISNDSAEALANLSLSELTKLTIDDITNKYNYYSFAAEKLKPLIDLQTK